MSMPAPSQPPRVFISYSFDSDDHRANIADLAQTLRAEGIDARIDQYVESEPPLSWPIWMEAEIDEADYVLVVATETYLRRFLHKEQPGRGFGVTWEGAIITSDLYYQRHERVKFIPVVVTPEDSDFIPKVLSLTSRYIVGVPGQRNLAPLLRHLRNQPALVPAPIGSLSGVETAESNSATGHLSPEEAALNDALAKATSGDTIVAEEELERLLQSQDRRVSGTAAYNIGRISQDAGLYTKAISAYERAIELLRDGSVAELARENLIIAIEAMNAHYGPNGPVAAAQSLLDSIRADDIQAAWALLDRDLRMALAQSWIIANEGHPNLRGYDKEAMANAFAEPSPVHPLARAFLATQLDEFQRAYQMYRRDTWGAGERPRRYGLDYELVILMQTGGEVLVWQPGEAREAIQLLMRKRLDGWRVANFSPEYVVPGWPPTTRPLEN